MPKPYKRNHLLLSVLSGLILWLAWPPFPFSFLLFFGFLPLLLIENNIYNNRDKSFKEYFLLYIFIAFLIWNGLATWWIKNATLGGAILAIIANSLLMCIPFFFFQKTKRIVGSGIGYFSFICYWLAFEYLHHQWELTWPWMTIGNGLANQPSWIQWYEYTGTLGGTLWVLLFSISFFYCFRRYIIKDEAYVLHKNPNRYATIKCWLCPLVIFISPFIISKLMYFNYEEFGEQIEVVVIQPNIDPYNEKFGGLSADDQLKKLIALSKPMISSNTRYLVWPETAIQHKLWLSKLKTSGPIATIKTFINQFSEINLVTGIAPYEQLDESTTSSTARKFNDGSCCYDAFNSAIQITPYAEDIPIYHKSKLVVGVERIPYPALFKFLEPFAINLGGVIGSLKTQEERKVFYSYDSIGIGPVICYESVFGEFVGEYIINGANLIFIITNDGWWGNTNGHKQHLYFASLRAIETRRSIARSANTGISCFVNQKGDILLPTDYGVEAAVKATISVNNTLTFYTKHGDYLGRISLFVGLLLIAYTYVKKKTARKPPQ